MNGGTPFLILIRLENALFQFSGTDPDILFVYVHSTYEFLFTCKRESHWIAAVTCEVEHLCFKSDRLLPLAP